MSMALSMRRTNLDLMCDRGKGVTKDHKEAVRTYRKAAKQGQTDAQSNLDLMCDRGKGAKSLRTRVRPWAQLIATKSV